MTNGWAAVVRSPSHQPQILTANDRHALVAGIQKNMISRTRYDESFEIRCHVYSMIELPVTPGITRALLGEKLTPHGNYFLQKNAQGRWEVAFNES